MVTLNTQVRMQDKSGNALATTSLSPFWSSVAGPDGVFDPKVAYDPHAGRWIFTACDDMHKPTSAVLIGVSRTSDPTGQWNLYSIDADPSDLVWSDFPSLGFNKNWIVVQMNMFENCGESNCEDKIDNDGDGLIDERPFSRSHIYVFDKADLYAGGSGRFTLISNS